MVPMRRTLTKKVDNVQEQISNVKRKVKALRNYQKEMLEIKSTAREMKNAFDEPIRRLDRAKERTVSFKIRQEKLLRLKHKENKNKKQNKKTPNHKHCHHHQQQRKEQNLRELWDNFRRCNTITGKPEVGEQMEEMFKVVMLRTFPN